MRRTLTAALAAGFFSFPPLIVGAQAPAQPHSASHHAASQSSRALFGGDIPFVRLEASHGYRLAVARNYATVGQKFGGREAALMAQGTTLMISLDTARGQSYADVAAGKYDTAVAAFLKAADATAVKDHLSRVFIDFEHEANGMAHHAGLGSPTQFRAAWDRLHALAVSQHLDLSQGGRLVWTEILTHWAYYPAHHGPGSGTAGEYYVGASETDLLGADGYNTVGCSRGPYGHMASGSQTASPASLFGPAAAFAKQQGKQLFIGEFASVAYPNAAVQAGWITAMKNYILATPTIAAAEYWNGPHALGFSCAYNVASRPASMAALNSMRQALTGTARQTG